MQVRAVPPNRRATPRRCGDGAFSGTAGTSILSSLRHLPRGGVTRRSMAPTRVVAPTRAARVVRMGAANAVETETGSGSLQPGMVVEVMQSSGRRRVGVVERADGKRNWIVEYGDGLSASVTPKQLSFRIASHVKMLGVTEVAKFEDAVRAEVEQADGMLVLAWEMLTDSDTPVTSAEVSELLFGDATVQHGYVAHCLLQEDRLYFKGRFIKGSYLYEARSGQLVEQVRAELQAEAKRIEEERIMREMLANSVIERSHAAARAAVGQAQFEAICRALATLAIDLNAYGLDIETKTEIAMRSLTKEERHHIKLLADALHRPPSAQMCCEALAAWDVFEQHENIFLRAMDLAGQMPFDPETIDAAEALMCNIPDDPDAHLRIDLTHLRTYAVDSADTTEVDDAISWDADARMVWVHIADPCRYLAGGADDALLQAALGRIATLYLPTRKYTMFPEALATDVLSLSGSASDGAALSFGFRVLDDGDVDEETMRVVNSRIAPPERMTYEEAESVLESGGSTDLASLHAVALERRKFRESEGAIVSGRPFCNVHVEDAHLERPHITLEQVHTGGSAWTLVSELMIAACNVAGLYAEERELAVIYRGQAPFALPSAAALNAIPAGVARLAAMFRNAPPSNTGLTPLSHASLGVDAYVQVTSPIRRACDLLAHLQIKAHLRGEDAPLDADRLNSEIRREADKGRRLRQVENRSKRYWQMLYLGERTAEMWNGTVVRLAASDKMAVVWLHDLAFDVMLPVTPGVKPGADVEVRIHAVEPRSGQCRGSLRVLVGKTQNDLLEVVSDVEEDSTQ